MLKKNYFVGTALVFMNLAAAEDFCPELFLQHSDFWLQVGVWTQHDSNVKSFHFNQARNVEIGRRCSCSATQRRSKFGSHTVHRMAWDSCACSALRHSPENN